MANRITKRERAAIVDAVSQTGNIAKACETLGRNRQHVYEIMGRDEGFAEQIRNARSMYLDYVADTATNLAIEGVITMQETQKKTAGKDGAYEAKERVITKRPDLRGAIRILERRHPDFKPGVSIDFRGQTGVLVVPVRPATADELEKLYADNG